MMLAMRRTRSARPESTPASRGCGTTGSASDAWRAEAWVRTRATTPGRRGLGLLIRRRWIKRYEFARAHSSPLVAVEVVRERRLAMPLVWRAVHWGSVTVSWCTSGSPLQRGGDGQTQSCLREGR